MTTKQYTDQIAYRAANYILELAKRDESPSKAARFAAIRYLDLMSRGRRNIQADFSPPEIDILTGIAKDIDWTHTDNYDTFWARVELAGFPQLSLRVKRLGTVLIDAIVDMAREQKHGGNQQPAT